MPDFGNPLPGRKKADPADTPTCGQAIVFNCATNLWQAACVAGGETNTSSNSGCGDGWALAKCGVDLPFKSLITTSPLATTVNATDLTITVDNIPISALADATDGNLITYDACGAPAFVATGTAAQVLTSNGVGTAPTFQAGGGGGGFSTAFKACDEGITCDTTLTNDCCLKFAVDANSKYALMMLIAVNSPTGPDFQHSWCLPTNATGEQLQDADITRGSPLCGADLKNMACTFLGTTDSTTNNVGFPIGFVETGACSGCVVFQWSQRTSSACTTTLLAGTWLAFKKLN